MKIIGFVNQKGGVGKTTFLINTAYALAKQGKKVFILDTDPQASVCEFMDFRENLGLDMNIEYVSSQISAFNNSLKSIINSGKDYDYLLVDTAGSGSSAVLQATKLMNYIIVPLQTSILDINSMNSFLEAVSMSGNDIPMKILINGVIASSTSGAKDLQEYFLGQNVDVFKSYICTRKPYKDSFNEGKSIIEFLDENNNALLEFNLYMKELLEWIGE